MPNGPFLEECDRTVVEETPLSKMSKAELVAHAESLGIDTVPDSMTKKDIIQLIENK